MPYPINKSDGSLLVNVPDYTRDTQTTSLTLLGRGVVDYGEGVAENFIHLMEHFAGPTPPAKPLDGQVWFHTFTPGPPPKTINKIKVWNGVLWVTVGGVANGDLPPSTPEIGDLWYNPATKLIYYWTGTEFRWIGGPSIEPDGPTEPQEGLLWWMIPERQLWGFDATSDSTTPPNAKRKDGSPVPKGWVLIGPSSPSGSGTYQQVVTINVNGKDIDLIKVYVNFVLVGVWTDQATALPGDFDANFTTYQPDGSGVRGLKPGLNLNNGAGMAFNGTANNADLFDGLDSSQFLRRDKSDTPSLTDSIDLGSAEVKFRRFHGSDLYAGTSTTATDDTSRINLHGMCTMADKLKPGAGADRLTTPRDFTALPTGDVAGVYKGFDGSADVSTQLLLTPAGLDKVKSIFPPPPAPITNYLKTDSDSGPTADASFNIGDPAHRFKTMHSVEFVGTATQAKYADLAERYEADASYAPGTVVKIGGSKEITATTEMYDMDVFGVISTAPGLMLNAEAGKDATHPYVALAGRVPIRVVGPVVKGQRLVSAEQAGCAKGFVGNPSMLSSLAVLGRALADKPEDAEALVLSVVGMK